MPSPHRERVFLIRMWQADEAGEHWRGSVRDVAAGKTFYVLGTREMADCVGAALAVPIALESDGRETG